VLKRNRALVIPRSAAPNRLPRNHLRTIEGFFSRGEGLASRHGSSPSGLPARSFGRRQRLARQGDWRRFPIRMTMHLRGRSTKLTVAKRRAHARRFAFPAIHIHLSSIAPSAPAVNDPLDATMETPYSPQESFKQV